MKVAILGCGAMGTVLGAYMTKNGCDVEMIDSYQAHVDALNEKGAHIVGTVDFTVPVKAVTPEQMEGIYDIVFLFTKQTADVYKRQGQGSALPYIQKCGLLPSVKK